ncbi:MAG TPA: hypothetical protein V6C69_18215 [Trichormus sp.]
MKRMIRAALVLSLAVCSTNGAQAANRYLQQGIEQYNAGHYSEAIGMFGAAEASEFNNPELHYYMANALARMNQKADAIREYKMALTLQPQGRLSDYCQSALRSLGALPAAAAPANSQAAASAQKTVVSPLKGTGALPQLVYLTCGCPLCYRMEKVVRDLQNKYYDKVTFTHLEQSSPNEKTQMVMKMYNISRCPTVLFLDPNGDVIAERTGMVAESDMWDQTKGLAFMQQYKTENDQHYKATRDQIMHETDLRIAEEQRRVDLEIKAIEDDVNQRTGSSGSDSSNPGYYDRRFAMPNGLTGRVSKRFVMKPTTKRKP